MSTAVSEAQHSWLNNCADPGRTCLNCDHFVLADHRALADQIEYGKCRMSTHSYGYASSMVRGYSTLPSCGPTRKLFERKTRQPGDYNFEYDPPQPGSWM